MDSAHPDDMHVSGKHGSLPSLLSRAWSSTISRLPCALKKMKNNNYDKNGFS